MPRLEWVGKDKVVNHHQDVPYKVLDLKYSFNNNDKKESENMIIKGDNLEALKSLLPKYEGKINCIYIDPPYNTGNEAWCYNDNVNDPKIKKWIGEVVGKEGEDLSRHDKWLCMMYPRLRLLHKLLANDGAIFISIDDNEQANLRLICDEIFGSNNFISFIPRRTKSSGKTTNKISSNHDYILIFCKDINSVLIRSLEHTDPGFKYYDKFIEDRGKYKLNQTLDYDSLQYSGSLDYPLSIDGNTYYAGSSYEKYLERKNGNHQRADWAWRWSPELFEFGYKNEFIVIKRKSDGSARIYTKTYMNAKIEKNQDGYYIDYMPRGKPLSTLEFTNPEYSNDNAKKNLRNVFPECPFDFPKPIELIETIFKISTDKNSIILDSFAGSGTTAHAVLNMNKTDGGNRKFILVEMEDYAETITAERVKRVIKGYSDVTGTGGDFNFYELGQPLLINNEYINEDVDIEKIRDYIFFMETRTQIDKQKLYQDNEHFLGENNNAAYYFYYQKHNITTLNYEFLSKIKTKAETYVIYADINILSEDELNKYNIVFKKTPRDITRL